jgi:hypothetical protein
MKWYHLVFRILIFKNREILTNEIFEAKFNRRVARLEDSVPLFNLEGAVNSDRRPIIIRWAYMSFLAVQVLTMLSLSHSLFSRIETMGRITCTIFFSLFDGTALFGGHLIYIPQGESRDWSWKKDIVHLYHGQLAFVTPQYRKI